MIRVDAYHVVVQTPTGRELVYLPAPEVEPLIPVGPVWTLGEDR